MKNDITKPMVTVYGDFEYPVNTLILFTRSTIVFTDTKSEGVLASIDIKGLTDIIPIDDVKFKVCLVYSPLRQIVISCTNKELRDELLNKIFNFKNFIDNYYDKKVVIINNDCESWLNILTLREITDVKIHDMLCSIKFYNLVGGFTEVIFTAVENNVEWLDNIANNINPDKLAPYSKIRNIFYNEENYKAVIKYVNEIDSPYIKII